MENVPTDERQCHEPTCALRATYCWLLQCSRSKEGDRDSRDNNEDDAAAGLVELLLKYQIMLWLGNATNLSAASVCAPQTQVLVIKLMHYSCGVARNCDSDPGTKSFLEIHNMIFEIKMLQFGLLLCPL